ncbi:hypothetical protein ABIB40_003330 [Pedobacter sp. UYP30]|uniref:hypothetical protein n=1 Tax=Pedobacter sp. UYP30 TaxID=1756400 RepID=UPI003399358E
MKNKTTLAFEMLESEMEIISHANLRQIIGGFDSAQDMVDYMFDNGYSTYNSSNGFGNEDFGLTNYFGSSSNGSGDYGSSGYGDSGYGGGGNGGVVGDPWDTLSAAMQFAQGLVTSAANYKTASGIHPQYNAADPGNCVFNLLNYVNGQKNPTSTKTQRDFFDTYLFMTAADKNLSSGAGGFGFSYSSTGSLNGVNTSGSIMSRLLNNIGVSANIVQGSGVVSALNSGKELATVLPNQGPNGEVHAIIIKSFDPLLGTYEVFDPTSGSTSNTMTNADLAGASYFIAL